MKNGNKVESMNNSKGSGATGWEGVAKQAGKFDAEAAKKAAQKDGNKQESNFHEYFQAGSTLADPDELKMEKLNKLSAAKARAEVDALLGSSNSKVTAKELGNQIDKVEQELAAKGEVIVAAQEAERQRAEQVAAAEVVLQEQTEKGFGGFLKKLFKKKENGTEESVSASAKVAQREKLKTKSINMIAQEYSSNLPKSSLLDSAREESNEVIEMQRKYEMTPSDSRLHKKLKKELARHGGDFTGANGISYEFTALSRPDKKVYDEPKMDVMRKKAKNWMTVSLCLNGKDAKQTKKRLKQWGLPTKCPKNWDDTSVTSYEMAKMAELCYGAFDKPE